MQHLCWHLQKVDYMILNFSSFSFKNDTSFHGTCWASKHSYNGVYWSRIILKVMLSQNDKIINQPIYVMDHRRRMHTIYIYSECRYMPLELYIYINQSLTPQEFIHGQRWINQYVMMWYIIFSVSLINIINSQNWQN